MQGFSQNKGGRSFGRCRNILFQHFFFQNKVCFFLSSLLQNSFSYLNSAASQKEKKG